MAALVWGQWSTTWLDGAKVDFDGFNKRILVHPEVTALDIRNDVYSAWVDWHEDSGDSQRWPFAIRYSGMDPIPGGESGGIFFLYNGWKLVIDFNKVAVTGVLYSDDYPTAYWSDTNQPLYPAVVSALVNNVTNTVTTTVVEQANPADIASQILATPVNTTFTAGSLGEYITKKLLSIAKFIGLR